MWLHAVWGNRASLREGGILWLAHVLSALLGTSASSVSFTMNEGEGRSREKVRARWAAQVLGPVEPVDLGRELWSFQLW